MVSTIQPPGSGSAGSHLDSAALLAAPFASWPSRRPCQRCRSYLLAQLGLRLAQQAVAVRYEHAVCVGKYVPLLQSSAGMAAVAAYGARPPRQNGAAVSDEAPDSCAPQWREAVAGRHDRTVVRQGFWWRT